MKYTGDALKEIIFPLGGIGSGCVGLSGTGNLVDWEIFNRPAKGTLNGYSQICVRTKDDDGNVSLKTLCSDTNKDLSGTYRRTHWTGYGFGVDQNRMNGFPHFKDCVFEGEMPIATLSFEAEDFPGSVKLSAFNPMIPHNADDSSLPAAFFEVEFKNKSDKELEFSSIFSLAAPFRLSMSRWSDNSVTMYRSDVTEDDINYSDISLFCQADEIAVQPYWYRGQWQDGVVTFWNELQSGKNLTLRQYDEAGKRDTCALQGIARVKAGECCRIRFAMTWNTPNCYNYWEPAMDETGKHKSWKNYYAVLFKDSEATGKYCMKEWDRLYADSRRFADLLQNSTLDPAVIDAAASNLAVLKTPTVLRLEDGSFYGWEGNMEDYGSCEGTCQHVWNYAYALCFLFPALERSIRENEFKYCLEEDGRTYFRMMLPLGRDITGMKGKCFCFPCVDGQMGCVIKTYREWKISGDTEWLATYWKDVKACLHYAWSKENPSRWDLDCDGVMEGRQHHTLDMELFGPSGWLQSFYLAALKAAAEMADALGDNDAALYRELYTKGKEKSEKLLFNGEYFAHKVDLFDKTVTDSFDAGDEYWNDEAGQIKYQIAGGSSIDQLCGQWHADICAIGDIFDAKMTETALESMYKYNFKPSMRDFVNPWRVFAVGDEGGCVMCDYPAHVEKPAIPVPYCEECMTGFEYELAGLWAAHGHPDWALQAVRAIRDRYDGAKRNPYNEIECGNNYARSMASFALLPIFAGMRFDLVKGYLGFDPIEQKDEFSVFFSLGNGWGSYHATKDDCTLKMAGGSLRLSSFGLPHDKTAKALYIDGKEIAFTQKDGTVFFATGEITDGLRVEF